MKRWLFLPSSVHNDIEALGRLRPEEVEKLKKILDSEAGKSRYAIYLQIVEELGVPDQDAARLHSLWEYARDEQTKHNKPAADVINEFVNALASSKEDHFKGVSRHIQENRSPFESLFGDNLKLESPDCCIDIDKLELPASLERVKGGIRVAGHRVSLFRIIDELLNGTSPDRLKEMFPTVPERKLEEVVSFCKQHDDAMQKYHAEYQAAFTAGVGSRIGEAPSLAELRRRKSETAK